MWTVTHRIAEILSLIGLTHSIPPLSLFLFPTKSASRWLRASTVFTLKLANVRSRSKLKTALRYFPCSTLSRSLQWKNQWTHAKAWWRASLDLIANVSLRFPVKVFFPWLSTQTRRVPSGGFTNSQGVRVPHFEKNWCKNIYLIKIMSVII